MLAASVLLALSIGQLRAQSILRTGPVEPLTYEQKEGRLKVLEGVVLDSPVDVSCSFRLDGEAVGFKTTERPDSVLVWLPMVDDYNVLELVKSGRKVSSFSRQAPVKKDWVISEMERYILYNLPIRTSLGWIHRSIAGTRG